MKKNKKWLKEQIEGLSYTPKGLDENSSIISKNWVLNFIDQLDEPETLSQEWIDENKIVIINNLRKMIANNVVPVEKLENLLVPNQDKPVIPQFVADWIESRDYYNVYKVLQDLSASGSPHASKDVRNWVFCSQENVEKFVRAWLDGYEVEREKKYYVMNEENELILGWSQSAYMTPCIEGYEYMKHAGRENLFQLTEQEIKEYDERYWVFAQEVTE